MFSAAGSSTPSALFRQIRRSPLLLRKDTVMPFLLRASTLLRIRWEKLLGVSPSAPAGSIFSNSTLAGALISGCRRSSSERKKESVRWAVLPVRSHLTAVSRYDPCHRTPASAPDRGCPVRRSRAWLYSPSFFLLRRKPLFSASPLHAMPTALRGSPFRPQQSGSERRRRSDGMSEFSSQAETKDMKSATTRRRDSRHFLI